jgi:hypothetical protein
VNRNERVKPSALAEAKKRPWTMQTLLQRGPEADGISAEQFEAGIEIVDAYEALTRSCGWNNSTSIAGASIVPTAALPGVDYEPSPREVRLISIYFSWAEELLRRVRLPGTIVVDWITDARSLGTIGLPLLVRALDLWTKQRDDWRPAGVDSGSARGVDFVRQGVSEAHRPPLSR